jgi:hypothetical protein
MRWPRGSCTVEPPGFRPAHRSSESTSSATQSGSTRPCARAILVGHSYGGLGSLTVIEPVCVLAVARGDLAWSRSQPAAATACAPTPRRSSSIGALFPLGPLTPELQQGAEAFFNERFPSEASIPLDPLPYPVVVVTGDHEPAFEVSGRLTQARRRRASCPAGHAVQNAWVQRRPMTFTNRQTLGS